MAGLLSTGGDPPHQPRLRPGVSRFVLVAVVDGSPAVARWSPTTFVCDPALLQGAEIIAALGDDIDWSDGGGPVERRGAMKATTDPRQPLALLCTLIRASDRIHRVDVEVADEEGPAVPPTSDAAAGVISLGTPPA